MEKIGQQRFELLAVATKSLDLQMILKDEQLRMDATAVVRIGCCHGHLFMVRGMDYDRVEYIHRSE